MRPLVPRGAPLLLVVLALGAACATPVGVRPGEPRDLYRSLTRNVLSAGVPSPLSEQDLRRRGLDARFAEDPEAVLTELRTAIPDHDPDLLFVLAELSFLRAEQSSRREHYLASAVYAYAFLVDRRGARAFALDPRARLAADLYNLGLTRGLAAEPVPARDGDATPQVPGVGTEVRLEARTVTLPFGQLELAVDPDHFTWSGYRLHRFVAVGDLHVRGLRNRYRQAGVGVPLAAALAPAGAGEEAERARRHIAPGTRVPVTAIVRLPDVAQGIATGRLRGAIELYPADRGTTVELEGLTLPLELEPSAALALQLEGAPLWEFELRGFLSTTFRLASQSLFMLHPYRPGRVPVVLVHGTASSPARWADLVNEIQNDPLLRERVQLWFFLYNTSNPILVSASDLRRSLAALLEDLDPSGRDAALRRMVVIGHSQGGLLTRLAVTPSGDRFWANFSSRPLVEVQMSPPTRVLAERTFFFEPLPFVERVVFLATPHRGSFRVSTLVLNLVRRLVRLPVTVMQGAQEAAREGVISSETLAQLPTAVDNMHPGHRFIQALAATRVAAGVGAHSIIAVDGPGAPAGLDDGVVTYASAHLEWVASERVVRSGHSLQSHPETILEVQRILKDHLRR